MNPAMVISFITGGLMVYSYGSLLVTETWFLAKVICLFLLVIIHMYMSKWRKEFEGDINQKSQKFFRYMNEVPTALMIIIVIMVIVKPF
jgi:putative membrane protein